MKKYFQKLPDSLVRILVVFFLFGGAILLIRSIIPPSIKDKKFQRASALERESSKDIKYIGSNLCGECHDTEYNIKKAGYHKNLSCETCHGPGKEHAENPTEIKPPAPRDRKFCPVCHNYNLSRPMGFPQINPVVHNPLDPCITCHNPHDPKPPQTPRECMACHGEIARTKSVSPHVQLECTTCHDTPNGHKVTPWSIKPTKPVTRDFCGKCHSKDSPVKKTLKIDIATHGEKYLCWQCHYPHMPEVE